MARTRHERWAVRRTRAEECPDLTQLRADRGIPVLTDRFGRFGIDVLDLRLLDQRIEPKDGLTLRQAMLHYDKTGRAEELVDVVAAREAEQPIYQNALAAAVAVPAWSPRPQPSSKNALSAYLPKIDPSASPMPEASTGNALSAYLPKIDPSASPMPQASTGNALRAYLPKTVSLTARRDELRADLQFDLVSKLRRGELVATGHSATDAPDEPARVIQRDKWRFLVPDFRGSRARLGDTWIEGILVFTPGMLRPGPRTPRARFSQARLREWYVAWVERCEADRTMPSLAEDASAAGAELGFRVPRESMREMRRELAPDEWKRPGRRRKAS